MTRKEAIALAERAFKLGEIADYLCGANNYTVPINQYISANVPTDFEYIIRVGLYGYYNKAGDTGLPEVYALAIEQLLQGDCASVWCAYMVCLFQIRLELRGEAPFSIMSNELVSKVSSALHNNKTFLKSSRLWQGKDFEEGLWQDIVATNKSLQANYGVSLI